MTTTRKILIGLGLFSTLGLGALMPARGGDDGKSSGGASAQAPSADKYVLGFKVKDIDGKEQDLSQYKGKVVLIVNVASRCGYTPQYAGLEKLYEGKKGQGFVILGFPSNDFGKQEPGDSAEIKSFCTSKFGVTFPMFEKIGVTAKSSDGQSPLYKKLASLGGEPKWNFSKYLVDRSGNYVQSFESKVKPDDAELTRQIDALLAGK